MASITHRRNAVLGAAFLMATSAIGPGFLTQTATFTNTLLASFGFVILLSILLILALSLIFGELWWYQESERKIFLMRFSQVQDISLRH